MCEPRRNRQPPTLLLFLKAPRAGEVKTRLAADIGPEKALAVYRGLAEQQARRLPADWPLEVHYTPSDARAEMERWLGHGLSFFAQARGDLGERLGVAARGAFATGARSVICLGADCPALDGARLRGAARALEDGADIVFGPADDGGYYLVGMNRAETAVFTGIPWSTQATLAVSLAAAKRSGLKIKLLERLSDIDTAADLARATAKGHLTDLTPHSHP